MNQMFRSLKGFNYRIWFAGGLFSNIGTWMQRTAQDWIVLTILTHDDAVAVGITMSLQLGPQLLLVPWSGLIADRFDRRKLLIATQCVMAALGFALGIMVVTGVAELWHVYAFAFALGVTSAIDGPARLAFVSELVSEKNLPNAAALNAASFNGARLIGPAVAGLLTVAVGAGWVFVINGFTFAATLISLIMMRKPELRKAPRAPKGPGQLKAGLSYIRHRPDLLVIIGIIFVIGTFGMNFPIFAATMTQVEFHRGASDFGVLSSLIAIGSLAGALLAARRERPRLRILFVASAGFGISTGIAALMPSFWTFGIALIFVGFTAISIMSTANGLMQTTTTPVMRGRVMSVYLAVFMGGTPIGAPIVGWVVNSFGPRWGLGVGALAGIVAAAIGITWMVVSHNLRLHFRPHERLRLQLTHDGSARLRAVNDLAVDEAMAASRA